MGLCLMDVRKTPDPRYLPGRRDPPRPDLYSSLQRMVRQRDGMLSVWGKFCGAFGGRASASVISVTPGVPLAGQRQ